jgi:murein DD-endopeptidase MepM/ murein hydrolase activator NlpD
MQTQSLIETLKHHHKTFRPVVPFNLNAPEVCIIEFGGKNQELREMDLADTALLTDYVSKKMKAHKTPVALGRYNENRTIYSRSLLFGSEKDSRTVHLGIDIFAAPGSAVFTPLPAKVHSFQNNKNFGDYGPTIILEHQLENHTFYTLYGHLSLESLDGLAPGRSFAAGDQIAKMGDSRVNGKWPPHLHFQLISDMLGNTGDFPGVCSLADRKRFLEICPDPNLILNIEKINES